MHKTYKFVKISKKEKRYVKRAEVSGRVFEMKDYKRRHDYKKNKKIR